MTKVQTNNIIRFISLLFLQILVCNNIILHDVASPFIYIIFILMLPVSLSPIKTIWLAFIMGLVLDIFSGTGGVQAFACAFIGFLRPKILRMIMPPGGYEDIVTPDVSRLGFMWFISFSVIMVFLHHLILIYIDRFSFYMFWSTMGRVFASSILTFAFVMIYAFMFYPKKRR